MEAVALWLDRVDFALLRFRKAFILVLGWPCAYQDCRIATSDFDLCSWSEQETLYRDQTPGRRSKYLRCSPRAVLYTMEPAYRAICTLVGR